MLYHIMSYYIVLQYIYIYATLSYFCNFVVFSVVGLLPTLAGQAKSSTHADLPRSAEEQGYHSTCTWGLFPCKKLSGLHIRELYRDCIGSLETLLLGSLTMPHMVVCGFGLPVWLHHEGNDLYSLDGHHWQFVVEVPG